jgi:arylsulfatase
LIHKCDREISWIDHDSLHKLLFSQQIPKRRRHRVRQTSNLLLRRSPQEFSHRVLSSPWELFNIRNDFGETTDLSRQEPAKTKAMLALWEEYVVQNGVILTDDGPFKAKAAPQKPTGR